MWPKLLPAVVCVALLTACDVQVGNDAGENATAAGRAQEGRLTIDAPGFNMSMNIPVDVQSKGRIDDSDLIYPGSRFGGIHVQGRPNRGGGEHEGEVELRFTTDDAADRVAAWYRDPVRGEEISVASVERQDGGFLVSGTTRSDKDRFALRITPRSGGGAEGRLLLSDRR